MNKVSIICATLLSFAALFFAAKGNTQYIYEANQDLFDLTNQTGTKNFNTGDDQLSNAFNLDPIQPKYCNMYFKSNLIL